MSIQFDTTRIDDAALRAMQDRLNAIVATVRDAFAMAIEVMVARALAEGIEPSVARCDRCAWVLRPDRSVYGSVRIKRGPIDAENPSVSVISKLGPDDEDDRPMLRFG